VQRSPLRKKIIHEISGWPFYSTFFDALHSERITATPLVVSRLQRVARAVGHPPNEVFLDEAGR
jgi:hypothetical protein